MPTFVVCKQLFDQRRMNDHLGSQQVMKLMEVIGNDEVISTLESLIEKYPAEVAPYAVELAQGLCHTFLVKSSTGGNDQGASLSLSAATSALIGLLQSLKDRPEVFPTLEEPLEAVLRQIFTDKCLVSDYGDDALEIINYLTYCSPVVSLFMHGFDVQAVCDCPFGA